MQPLNRKLDELKKLALSRRVDRQLALRTRACAGLDIETVVNLVIHATAEKDHPILEAIFEQVEDYAERSKPDPDGKRWPHGFFVWLCGLVEGWGSLPERLPTAFLTSWRDGYEKHCGYAGEPRSPQIISRCEGCR